jgi:hypothetical protein
MSGTVSMLGLGGNSSSSINATITFEGMPYTANGQARRNLHVQFSAASTRLMSGATGIPGRTWSTNLADLWLLGCSDR